jgi:prefoldin subunit 5
MISSVVEYEKVREELRRLEDRLNRLETEFPVGSKGFTKAGVRKMIARLHEELGIYEGSEEARQSASS